MFRLSSEKFGLSVRTACVLMATITIARGSSFLLSKQLLGTMEPLSLLGFRFLMAFAILFLLFLRGTIATVRKDPKILVASFVLGSVYFLCMASELIGLKYTTASTCSFLENTAIIMVPVLEAVLLKRLPRPLVMISTIAAVIGIGLIVFGSGDGAGSFGIGIGEGLCMIAALLYAVAIIITDRFSKGHDPMALGILYVGIMGALGMLAALFAETPQLPQTGGQWLCLIALAVLCTCFGFAIQPVAQRSISSETTGMICALNPLTTAVLGWTLLGESLGIGGIVGAMMIIGGILLPNLRSGSLAPEDQSA